MFINAIRKGINKGFKTTWMLAKIMIPVYFIVTFLKYTPVLDGISFIFKPLMMIFGLPGEAALPLVLGNFINLYAAIGAMGALTLNAYQITILAVMLSFSHSQIVESAIIKKVGLKIRYAICVRVSAALISGAIMGLIGRFFNWI